MAGLNKDQQRRFDGSVCFGEIATVEGTAGKWSIVIRMNIGDALRWPGVYESAEQAQHVARLIDKHYGFRVHQADTIRNWADERAYRIRSEVAMWLLKYAPDCNGAHAELAAIIGADESSDLGSIADQAEAMIKALSDRSPRPS